MEIIKEGIPLEEIKYRFVCPICGCEFLANKTEINEENMTYNCPNCGQECNGVQE